MLYKSLFQLYPDNFQNNYFLLSDKLEDNYTVHVLVAKRKLYLSSLAHYSLFI